MPIQLTREQWLTEAASLILDDILTPELTGYPVPPYKVSVAPLHKSTLAICYKRETSEKGYNEIFVTAHSADSIEILGMLIHELIHAYDDYESGHRGFFASMARAVGLTGKMRETSPGEALTRKLSEYVDLLGPIPHAQLNLKPKQKGRNNNKLECECGFSANVSKSQAERVAAGARVCPACGEDDERYFHVIIK